MNLCYFRMLFGWKSCLSVSVFAQEWKKLFVASKTPKADRDSDIKWSCLIIAAFITPTCWFHFQQQSIKNVQWTVIVTAMKQEGNTKQYLSGDHQRFFGLCFFWFFCQFVLIDRHKLEIATVKHPGNYVDVFALLRLSLPPAGWCVNGGLITSEARDGGNPNSAAAAAPPAACRSARRGSAAHAAPGCPEGDLPGVPLSDRTGDCPGHCHSHHGDLPDHTSHTGTHTAPVMAVARDWRVSRSTHDKSVWGLRPRQDKDFIYQRKIVTKPNSICFGIE